ncbi:MAG: phosphoglycerate dehydrogenase [Chloroflexi bacterium]|nr:phosphoglycerate dehydrogenase [Chloroflexota bacterium]
MKNPTILISAPYMMPSIDRFTSVLQHYGCKTIVAEVNERLSEEEIIKYAGQFDGVICGDDRFTPKAIDACLPRLKVISKWGTGIDSIDKTYAEGVGVTVRNTPNAFTLPVSDTVMGLMLSFARGIPWMDRDVKGGLWSKYLGRSLSECVLGVIGVGNIGKAVIRRARAFGMKILGNDIVPIAPDFIIENGVEMTSLEDLLGRSDFISLNCDLNPTSFHIINHHTMESVKPGAILINTARGPLVEESALVDGLKSGLLGGAGFDVFEVEPLPKDSPLLKFDNILLSAHNSNASTAAWERVHRNTIHNLFVDLEISHDDLEQVMMDSLSKSR